MKTATDTSTGETPYAIRPLRVADRARVIEHLLALDDADRSLRFGAAADPAVIARYVEAIEFDRGAVLGVGGSDGTLVGVAHLAFADGVAELGLSVASGHRERGVASALAARALRTAEALGAREFRFHCAATNEGMRRLAQRLGMEVSAEGSELIARRALPRTGAWLGAHSTEDEAALAG